MSLLISISLQVFGVCRLKNIQTLLKKKKKNTHFCLGFLFFFLLLERQSKYPTIKQEACLKSEHVCKARWEQTFISPRIPFRARTSCSLLGVILRTRSLQKERKKHSHTSVVLSLESNCPEGVSTALKSTLINC